ncbi:hypothetical protein EJ05DRAFT_24788 [Pseudovirgaria hyperparasitica]|uniref:Uncharacterized protein n=1 Tax=Pseudovirgaria hyperparasitica TaxID=470096 RepID=A0A6A6WLI7_9PEZI|nr:uncharacterized protein EJ05DRAFT_24788 [Pseudovirgaria hyperparasitica]KAF2763075.1 hypothetical protein EJ05DRAFT_24788 [Pseudovirgaria hyperparasitica]
MGFTHNATAAFSEFQSRTGLFAEMATGCASSEGHKFYAIRQSFEDRTWFTEIADTRIIRSPWRDCKLAFVLGEFQTLFYPTSLMGQNFPVMGGFDGVQVQCQVPAFSKTRTATDPFRHTSIDPSAETLRWKNGFRVLSHVSFRGTTRSHVR